MNTELEKHEILDQGDLNSGAACAFAATHQKIEPAVIKGKTFKPVLRTTGDLLEVGSKVTLKSPKAMSTSKNCAYWCGLYTKSLLKFAGKEVVIDKFITVHDKGHSMWGFGIESDVHPIFPFQMIDTKKTETPVLNSTGKAIHVDGLDFTEFRNYLRNFRYLSEAENILFYCYLSDGMNSSYPKPDRVTEFYICVYYTDAADMKTVDYLIEHLSAKSYECRSCKVSSLSEVC